MMKMLRYDTRGWEGGYSGRDRKITLLYAPEDGGRYDTRGWEGEQSGRNREIRLL